MSFYKGLKRGRRVAWFVCYTCLKSMSLLPHVTLRHRACLLCVHFGFLVIQFGVYLLDFFIKADRF